MEEDIKLLEEMKANCIKGMMKGAIYTDEKAERKAIAIENLIKGYREKEESEKYLYDAYQDAGKKMFEYAEQLENSVPKSKIKEKIEELEEEIDKLADEASKSILENNQGKFDLVNKSANNISMQIQALRELMEDK